MNKLLKLLLIFSFLFSITLIVSPLNNKSNLDNNIIQYKNINASQATYEGKIPNRRIILEPVVKLTQVSFPDPGDIKIVGTATGFSIKYDRKLKITYILTNHHFCENNTELDIGYLYTKSDNNTLGRSINPEKLLNFVYSDEKRDLCILSTSEKIKPIKFGDYRKKLKSLDRVYIIGAPKGIFPIALETYFTGYIQRDVVFVGTMGRHGHDYLLISEIVFGGHSGSPIFDQNGELVGVIFAKFGNSYGGLGIGLADIIEFIDESNI